MKKTLIGAAIVAAIAFTGAANAQSTASATFNVGARIVSPISITKIADMNFGDVVPSSSAGTVVLTTAGARSVTGGASLGLTGATSAATFTVNGQANYTYAITLPSAANISDGASHTMSVGTFTSSPSSTGTLDAGGSQALALGATLNVGASQVPGTYSGSFSVTVAYN